MAESVFDIGDRVKLTGTFTNAAGVLTNPTVVTCKVRTPSGTVTSHLDAANPSAGVFTKEIEVTEAGMWRFRFEGTGAVKAAEEGFFDVEESVFA